MKKLLILILVLLICAISSGNEIFHCEKVNEKFIVHFENENLQINEAKNEIKKIFAVPANEIEIIVTNCEKLLYTKSGEFVRNSFVSGENCVKVASSFVMRELYAHQIKIDLFEENEDNFSVLKSIDFEIIPASIVTIPDKISAAFLPVYQAIADNYENSYLADMEVVPSKMLIITASAAEQYLELFINWKEAKGISTEIATLAETGNISSEIKSYIQNIYDTSENPPDYLIFIGDVDDSYAIPSFYFGAENDATDHPYTLLDGDDYFPEMLVGRISVDSPMELVTVLNKILAYEKTPYVEDPIWFTRALLVAGNWSSSPPIPSTPVKVSRWLREKMINFGYTQVDTVFYPPIYQGASEITNFVNNGVGFVNYRGWGDANGWHYPYFHIENVEALTNGLFLPIVTSFVCNTGDFANAVDPCFGETWLRLGTPSSPSGGVAFIGPSDLYTSTKYNNAIFSGFYYGMLDEEILTFGSALLRGKMELFNNFPLNQESGDNVEFYFHVYNILGDPSLAMWTKIPEEINCNLPEEISLGTNYLVISVPDFGDGIVTAIKEDEFCEAALIENGSAILYFNSEAEGEITITITKPNFIPYIQTIYVVEEEHDIGLVNYQTDTDIIAGEMIALSLTLQNFGSQTETDVSAILSSENPYVTFIENSADFGDIEPNAAASQNYTIEILADCPDGEILEFLLQISDGNDAKFQLIANSLLFDILDFSILDENGILEPGEEEPIEISIQNVGSIDVLNLECSLSSLNDAVSVTSDVDYFDTSEVGTILYPTFTIFAQSDCYIGRSVPLLIEFSDTDGHQTELQFSLEIGEIDATAPTGPDNFGYFAYDSYDTEYDECPTYQWYEIDPAEGENGEVFELGDDVSKSIALPFNFTYYSEVFDSITICSNGWISFITTWETNFRNWSIPAALGPYAMLAPYWDDLIGANDEPMRVCYFYDEGENVFIVEWNSCVNNYDETSVEKFEIVLFDPAAYPTEDGNAEIQFNYHTVNNPGASSNYATVGIENLDQSDGLLYTYANDYPASAAPLQNGLAIKFTTDSPDNYMTANDEMNQNIDNTILRNYPNPFSSSTTISFNLATKSHENTRIEIYNIKGQKVKTLNITCPVRSLQLFGGEVVWDGKDENGNRVSNGYYFAKLKVNGEVKAVKKMVFLR